MANKSKNTEELASDLDDDTSELELLPSTWSDPAQDYEAESDAATHSFESLESEGERKSVDMLQVELRERDDYIGRLEYDLEQLRARATGLDTELKARGALTEGLAAELQEARQALLAARDRLDERDQAFTELESRLKGSETALKKAHGAAASLRSEMAALETARAEDERRIGALTGELEHARTAHTDAAAERYRQLRQENERLAGALLGSAGEIRGQREQAARIEAYADALRRQLQDRAAELDAMTTSRQSTQAALDDARAKVAELHEQVDRQNRATAALQEASRAERERLEKTLEEARAELAVAEEAVAASRSTSEQLASELVDTTGSRLALESQLSRAEEEWRAEIARLKRQIKRLEQALEDSESKVANKDAAISVLLAELADKPQAGVSDVQADTPPPRPGERRTPAADDKHGGEKERTTRLLVGTIDGQEVRFPLFKNKLTIGRTAHNDIQLKQQFISRRHAVVVCENDSTRIVDWGSKNGIYVNGARVSEKVLKSGDQLTVGTAEFRFEERPKR
ncbi:MAG TPA: FHA domain-containing protein [Woeseiaceae bacterium]|nr:FHA domain-containing protein [Woeseiaceae bacterium]